MTSSAADAEIARRRARLTLVAYMVLVTAVVTLAPFRFVEELTWRTTREDPLPAAAPPRACAVSICGLGATSPC